jgi:hypothetical protein
VLVFLSRDIKAATLARMRTRVDLATLTSPRLVFDIVACAASTTRPHLCLSACIRVHLWLIPGQPIRRTVVAVAWKKKGNTDARRYTQINADGRRPRTPGQARPAFP